MEEQPETKGFYHRSFVYAALFVSVGYLLLSKVLVGFKTDQLVLVFIFNALFFFSKATRKFILGFSIFIVYWILFDYMKAFPNYRYNMVHIQDLYETEKHVFGINLHGLIVTPNEFWKANSSAFLDVLTGLFYLMWVPVPLAFAVHLFFKKKTEFVHFSLVFVWVNLLGFVVYYLFPAAPPWYVQTHGFNFIAGTPGNTAGLARFDQFFNITLFKGIYSKGSNVFAAMPSLHSAYPLIVVYYALKNKLVGINIFFITVMVGIWFSAVYSSHHYCLDVLAGISCAILGIVSFQFLVKKAPLKHFVAYMAQKIA